LTIVERLSKHDQVAFEKCYGWMTDLLRVPVRDDAILEMVSYLEHKISLLHFEFN
jgi:hypothetical protein